MTRQAGVGAFNAHDVITIGMVDAGVRAYEKWRDDPAESEDITPIANLVYWVYEAMEAARISEHQDCSGVETREEGHSPA